jgi:hypothetical protein
MVRTISQTVEKVMASVTGGWGEEGCETENYHKAQNNIQKARQISAFQCTLPG